MRAADTELRCWVTDGSGPLVVLSHGASLDHRMFAAQVPALTAAGYRVLLWDLRGHGRSGPLGAGLSVATAADDLVAILDEVAANEVVLVGHSFGGYVSQELTFRRPGQVRGLCVIGSTDITERPTPLWTVLYRLLPTILRLLPDRLLRPGFARQMGTTRATREYALEATRQLPRDVFIAAFLAAVRALLDDPGYGEGYRIGVPFLLTHGDRDTTGNGAAAKGAPGWAARSVQCRHEAIPHAGHNPNQDNPEHFNRTLLAWLDATISAGSTPSDHD